MAACGFNYDDEKKGGSATVLPAEDFDAETDAKVLYKAMKGFGTDEDKIIGVVAFRSSQQLMQVEKKFQTMYGDNLSKWLEKELKGNLEKVVLGRFFGPRGYQAKVLRDAMAGAGTDETALCDVICTKNKHEMEMVRRAYEALYKRNLIEDLQSECSGDFKRIMVALATAGRDTKPVDKDLAKDDAKDLYDAGQGQWGTDEGTFNRIFAGRSFPQLRATMVAYKKKTGEDMAEVIEKEMGGDLKLAFLTLVLYIQDPINYYCHVLYRSMKGMGTDDERLIRTVLSRCEIDLGAIKERYEKLHQRTLDKAIKKETSGDYEKIMLALVRDP